MRNHLLTINRPEMRIIMNKFENETFKQLIGGSTASYACSMQGYKNEKLRFFIYTAFGTALLVLMCLTVYIYVRFDTDTFSARPAGSYVTLQPGSFETIEDASTPIGIYNELTLSLPTIPKSGSNLIFYIKHEKVKVYVGSELVYSLSPDDSSFIKTTGTNWCIIPIYSEDAEETVRVVLTPLYSSMAGTLPTFYFGSQFKIYEHLLAPNIVIYFICLLAVLCGLFFILFSLINITNPHIDNSLLMIGIFSILIGVWKFMDLNYTALIIKNPLIQSYTSYFCLLMTTIPFISFLRKSFTDCDNFLWNIPCLANITVAAIIIVLQLTSVVDIRDNLWLIHTVMLSNIPVVFIMFYREITTHGWNNKLRLSFACVFACLVGLLADIIVYYTSNGDFPSFLGITCLLFYIIALGASSLKDARALMTIGIQAKTFEEMAYHDQLTGLFNRTAYAKYTGQDNFKPDGHIVVMFDLNNLKACNDSLGHEHGDSYIIESAGMIEKAFGAYGSCYRIGGDEFCALLRGISISKCVDCIAGFKKMLEEYNLAHPDNFPLNIACGYEIYDPDKDYDIGDTLRRADKMMYLEKFSMKKKNHEAVR